LLARGGCAIAESAMAAASAVLFRQGKWKKQKV
jgi:hypothetical protein